MGEHGLFGEWRGTGHGWGAGVWRKQQEMKRLSWVSPSETSLLTIYEFIGIQGTSSRKSSPISSSLLCTFIAWVAQPWKGVGRCSTCAGRRGGILLTSHLSPPRPATSGLLSSPPGPVPHPLLPCAPQTPSHRGRGGGPCRRGDCRGPAHGSSHEPETY